MDIIIILFESGHQKAITETILLFDKQKNPKIACAAI